MTRLLIDFSSQKLHMSTNLYVILPNTNLDFFSNGVRYNKDGKLKVVWLLHGMGDDYTGWLRYSNVERYAMARGIAVICPSSVPQSMYSDMVKGLSYFSYIADELPAFIHETFPQISMDREDNYIAGLSMGGYGALKFGLSRPEQYCKVGCLSCGNIIDLELPPEPEEENFLTPFYGVARNAFGVPTMKDATGTKDDLHHLADELAGTGRPIPDLYMYCGENDFVRSISDQTASYLKEKLGDQTNFVYKTGPGEHNWDFWDHWLPIMLDDFGLTSLFEKE